MLAKKKACFRPDTSLQREAELVCVTHVLSFAFWLVFLAYGAVQNLESFVNTEGDLGTFSLGVLYLSFTFFSLFASLLVRILSPKRALVLGTTGYWLFIASHLKPSWYTMIPASDVFSVEHDQWYHVDVFSV